jgi:hypothetical protein
VRPSSGNPWGNFDTNAQGLARLGGTQCHLHVHLLSTVKFLVDRCKFFSRESREEKLKKHVTKPNGSGAATGCKPAPITLGLSSSR